MELLHEEVGSMMCGMIGCEAPADLHFVFEDGNNVVSCFEHADIPAEEAMDRHLFCLDCTMPGTVWIFSTETEMGYCRVEQDRDVLLEKVLRSW